MEKLLLLYKFSVYNLQEGKREATAQIREQILVPDLYVFTVESVALFEDGFFMFSGSKKSRNIFLKIP